MAEERSKSFAQVVGRLDAAVTRLEAATKDVPEVYGSRPSLSPAERQEIEIRGARTLARNWAMAVDGREELELYLVTVYQNNTEARDAALDEVRVMYEAADRSG